MIDDDTPAVLALMRKLWPDCDDEAVTDDATFVVARDDGALGGFITLTLRPRVEGCADEPVAFVEGWWVDEDLRGQGWGRALMAAAEAWARGLGAGELGSDSRVDNPGSIAAHLRLGFEEVERAATFRKVLAARTRPFVRRARPDLPALIAAANLIAHARAAPAADDDALTAFYDALLFTGQADCRAGWPRYLAGLITDRELRDLVLDHLGAWLARRRGRPSDAPTGDLPEPLIDLVDRALLGRPAR